MTVGEFNQLSKADARKLMLEVCGSTKWANGMVEHRPFATVLDVIEVGGKLWSETKPNDWLEAFAAHPRIGEKSSSHFSQREQELSDDDRIQQDLARLNKEYEAQHNFIFIVFASGKKPAEMLDILGSRIKNDTDTEMRFAAAEQGKIVRHRLERMFT
ncbi:MAG TPA: 2-oxo-4-hydroxy-4-carboxy-5-ureidoimidazoline decarboxylase [Longimicrobiales bacterium]|nr:2-oxo-4-hydroxy-4-carboxy-5-ureidoimidazoline decarboxylase [Longimicrobiales bacterium]